MAENEDGQERLKHLYERLMEFWRGGQEHHMVAMGEVLLTRYIISSPELIQDYLARTVDLMVLTREAELASRRNKNYDQAGFTRARAMLDARLHNLRLAVNIWNALVRSAGSEETVGAFVEQLKEGGSQPKSA